ncbi:MAG: HAD family hydrolase [Flavobacteriales bacterium]|nr:HAD family hydrolase [Flavobacteriales bacterium]
MKGLFLDRDGVINKERGTHTCRLADFEILPGVPEAIAEANAQGWAVVVITNQSGIDLGLYDHLEVDRMHRYLHDMLRTHGARVADILYCPHHPTVGKCLCRKPGPLLLERAAARHGIDLGASVMIGDRDRDMEAAAAVGVRGILVEPNASLLVCLRTQVFNV